MTEVLSISQPDGNTHFGSSLRRSSSQTSLLLQNPSSCSRPSSSLKSRYAALGYSTKPSPSLSSSCPSSPRSGVPGFSVHSSYTTTPASSLSLDESCNKEEEQIAFPSYDCRGYFDGKSNPDATPNFETSHAANDTQSASDSSLSLRAHPKSTSPTPIAGDDSAIRIEPTRHVDYLSHSWKEEDIWYSWRHIVARRKVYSNSARLENASWRTWAKAKYRLSTVSPEALNWLKDHDVTWLYGPLQTGNIKSLNSNPTPPTSQLSRSNSFFSKKPILKKRSLSEIMLQRSLSSFTLMKQATDALRAQQPDQILRQRPVLGNRSYSDCLTSESETPLTRLITYPSTSTSTSGVQTPCTRKHIHFNNEVEQCIAINKEADDAHDYFSAVHDDDDDSSSENELLMMKPVRNPIKAKLKFPSTPRNSFSTESKTIAMLPSTTLNYRGDTPEPAEQEARAKERCWSLRAALSPSPSQQTLKPAIPSNNFLLDDEDVDLDWNPAATQGDEFHPRVEMNDENESDGSVAKGLRRTPSGMFMPYEDKDEYSRDGLVGKIVDTVNTAKDIAHVIWNVGWRR